MTKYKKNEDYFSKIDSEDKAYFLGLLYADGYIFNAKKSAGFTISLKEDDVDILNVT